MGQKKKETSRASMQAAWGGERREGGLVTCRCGSHLRPREPHTEQLPEGLRALLWASVLQSEWTARGGWVWWGPWLVWKGLRKGCPRLRLKVAEGLSLGLWLRQASLAVLLPTPLTSTPWKLQEAPSSRPPPRHVPCLASCSL